jgi:hypothetical protein
VHRQPGLHVLFRFIEKDVAAAVRAEVVMLAFMLAGTQRDAGRIVRLGEEAGTWQTWHNWGSPLL